MRREPARLEGRREPGLASIFPQTRTYAHNSSTCLHETRNSQPAPIPSRGAPITTGHGSCARSGHAIRNPYYGQFANPIQLSKNHLSRRSLSAGGRDQPRTPRLPVKKYLHNLLLCTSAPVPGNSYGGPAKRLANPCRRGSITKKVWTDRRQVFKWEIRVKTSN
jgi:hypothetical protein